MSGAVRRRGIARAVELLVVGPGDLGDAPELARPRDLLQELVGLRDVALDPTALRRRTGCPCESRARRPPPRLRKGPSAQASTGKSSSLLVAREGAGGQVHERAEALLLHHRRLVRAQHRSQHALRLGAPPRVLRVDRREVVRAGATGLERLEPGPQVVGLDALEDVGEALPDRDRLRGVELLPLPQVLLLDRDLAEVVEERGVAQLLHLVPREARTSANGPVVAPSTFSTRPTVRMATRSEWPEVVGSRCSTAATAAWMNSSKSFRIRSMRSAFSKATAAWLASDSTRFRSTEVKEMTWSSTSEADWSTAAGSRFLLMSWTTPITTVLVVLHGHDQHRLRAVARLLVEGAADGVGRALREVVGVLLVHRLPGERHVARDRGLVEGDRELLEVHGHAVVLGELEAQPVAVPVAASGARSTR